MRLDVARYAQTARVGGDEVAYESAIGTIINGLADVAVGVEYRRQDAINMVLQEREMAARKRADWASRKKGAPVRAPVPIQPREWPQAEQVAFKSNAVAYWTAERTKREPDWSRMMADGKGPKEIVEWEAMARKVQWSASQGWLLNGQALTEKSVWQGAKWMAKCGAPRPEWRPPPGWTVIDEEGDIPIGALDAIAERIVVDAAVNAGLTAEQAKAAVAANVKLHSAQSTKDSILHALANGDSERAERLTEELKARSVGHSGEGHLKYTDNETQEPRP